MTLSLSRQYNRTFRVGLRDLGSLRLSLLKPRLANVNTREVLTLSKAMSAFLSASGMVPRASRYGYYNMKHEHVIFNCLHTSFDFFFGRKRFIRKGKKTMKNRQNKEEKTSGNIRNNKRIKERGGG